MVLQISLVIDALSESGFQYELAHLDSVCEFFGIELFVGQPLEDAVLYVEGQASEAGDAAQSTIVFCQSSPVNTPLGQGASHGSGFSSATLPANADRMPVLHVQNASPAHVINCVNRYMAKASICLEAIRKSYYDDYDIQGVCQALSDFVGNPVLAYDTTLLPIAQTEFPREYAQEIFGEDKLGTDYILSTVGEWDWEPHIDTLTYTGAFTVSAPDNPVVTAMCNVFWGGELQGRLEIFQVHKPISKGDMHMLEQACKIIAVSRPLNESSILLGHLLGQNASERKVEHWFTSLRWQPDDGIYVLAMVLPEAYKDSESHLGHVLRHLLGFLPYSVVTQMDSAPVIVSNDRLTPRDKALADLLPFLESVGPTAYLGASEVMVGVGNLHEGYAHAQFAVRLAQDGAEKKQIVCFEECRFAFLADLCKLHESKHLILEDVVVRMFEDDVRTGSENVLTARTYIESGFNLSATASVLCVHRNTAAYRLKHMSDRYGLDLSSPLDKPSELFHVLLSCKLLLGDM